MWQRDSATGTYGWGMWLGVALALHVGLLAAANSLHTPAWRAIELVRVSLVMGDGAKGDGAPVGGGQPSVAAPPLPKAEPVPERKPVAAKQRGTAPKLRKRPLPEIAAAPAPVVLPAAPPEPAAASGGVVDGATTTAAAGAGVGTGRGTGEGSGEGAGRGSGRGTGTGGDQRGFCVYCPEPGYPMIARRRGWSGKVDVELILLADGRVESADVMRSSGYDVLDREAVDVARRSRFRLPDPAVAPVRGHIEYRFELMQ